jgi:hypothetical protein
MDASQQIDKMISDLSDWRGELYAKLRQIINAAGPELQEEIKWGAAVWIRKGNICSVGAMKDHVKINFFKGASISDPDKLFNAGLDAKKTRAIDFFKGDKINEPALKDLIKRAIELDN